MMTELNLKYSHSLSRDTGSFKLLQLSPELLKVLKSPDEQRKSSSWVIKGQSNDDAVLCTEDKTYSIRSVVLSNSVLVVTSSPTDKEKSRTGEGIEKEEVKDVTIRDELHEILELIPCVPRLHKLNGLLRGREYDEGHEEDEQPEELIEEMIVDRDGGVSQEIDRPAKRRRFTYDDAKETLQSSDVELAKGLKDRRVLILEGDLRPIAHSHLTTILELLLNYLVSLSFPHHAAPAEELASALELEHDIKRGVSTQVMAWFGEVQSGLWKMNVNTTVKEVGMGILRAYRDNPIPEDEFMSKWRTTVGDTFETIPSLDLLAGNYLSFPSPLSIPPVPVLTYFPSSELPSDPAARFSDLFLTRSKWKAEEISPFLSDIVVNDKERDKLLLTYARVVTDPSGVWYTARAKYNG